MKRYMATITILVVLIATAGLAVRSQADYYTNHEMDQLFAPIALYPDPLLAQVLPAATYPDQLYDAHVYLARGGSRAGIDNQDWDVSVKAVSHYPSVLNYMVNHPDWTIAIGQADIDQPSDVFASIQRLRHRAREYGFLASNRYQRVYLSSDYIMIDPYQAQYIYVPEYNPEVVYVHRRTSYNSMAFSFGIGLVIGVWLDRDVDWGHHRVYYSGWSGPGWQSRSRPYVQVNNTYYVNNNYSRTSVAMDHSVTTRNITSYRQSVRQNTTSYAPPRSTGHLTANYGRTGGAANGRPAISVTRPNAGANGKPTTARQTTTSRGPSARQTTSPKGPSARLTTASKGPTARQTTTSRGASVRQTTASKSPSARTTGSSVKRTQNKRVQPTVGRTQNQRVQSVRRTQNQQAPKSNAGQRQGGQSVNRNATRQSRPASSRQSGGGQSSRGPQGGRSSGGGQAHGSPSSGGGQSKSTGAAPAKPQGGHGGGQAQGGKPQSGGDNKHKDDKGKN